MSNMRDVMYAFEKNKIDEQGDLGYVYLAGYYREMAFWLLQNACKGDQEFYMNEMKKNTATY